METDIQVDDAKVFIAKQYITISNTTDKNIYKVVSINHKGDIIKIKSISRLRWVIVSIGYWIKKITRRIKWKYLSYWKKLRAERK